MPSLTQVAIEFIGLVVLIYIVGVVLHSIFAKEPDDEVDIRSSSPRSRIHRTSITKSQGQSNANHRRR
jgi:hypothetical protein